MASRTTNGAAIRELRKAYGIKQATLADAAGISASYLSRIETGEEQPDVGPTVRKIADRLGVELDAITYPIPDRAEQVA